MLGAISAPAEGAGRAARLRHRHEVAAHELGCCWPINGHDVSSKSHCPHRSLRETVFGSGPRWSNSPAAETKC